ncbi:MAG: helix-turn-helix transcriptional regulator [Lachnospiraceae bacterium]|nr:helix-turn-helix transcriptional regulator [Lachnospiraceae bacterium]
MKYEITSRRLKEALNDNNMKPQELADASGVNKSSISQYINGSHAPSNTSSGRMASVLHVSPLWLMGFDAPKYEVVPAATISSLTEEEMAIALGYRKADEGRKESVAILLGVKRKENARSSTIREEKIG